MIQPPLRALSFCLALSMHGCTTYHDIERGEQAGTYLVCQTTDFWLFSSSKIVEYQFDRARGKLVRVADWTGGSRKK